MSATNKIKVMLVDDHPIVREGLGELLEHSGDFEVVGQAPDGQKAVSAAQRLRPDVVVMDVIMPRKDGVEACREITDLLPDTSVLILTASTQEDAVVQAIAAGATGYLQKYSSKQEFLAAVREVAQGRVRIPNDILKQVFATIRGQSQPTAPHGRKQLTTREQDILRLFAHGNTYAQIAETLGYSPVTIRNTIYRIQNKLAAKTKQQIVVWAVRNGLLDNPEPN